MDLHSLQKEFDRENILLVFNGPLSASLIEEFGKALRNYMQSQSEQANAAMDVFGVFIELTQNIRHYGNSKGMSDYSATVVVAHSDEHYQVGAGNMVDLQDGERLLARVNQLAALDRTALKAAYKEQMRAPRDANAASGAGLGLLDMARKSTQPLRAEFKPVDAQRGFFSLTVVI
jgi:hypothetical protein